MVLLFLVGLLSRRLERVNANVSRLLKATIMNGARPADAPAAPSPSPATPASPHAGGAASPVPESLARELVNGHVTMLKKTPRTLRSSLSADDFASLRRSATRTA
ncbi:hypothetical protein JL722_11568 [Aureococcus anophagefferens]|nr:hypothetical protein JL722_11568 [Aureococcus anophagefferens]